MSGDVAGRGQEGLGGGEEGGAGVASTPDGTSGPVGGDGSPLRDISILYLVNVLLRHRSGMVLVPIAVAVLVVVVSVLLPRKYSSTASFTPQSDQMQASQLAGLASQFGISVPTGQTGQSPQFYADLLESRELLRETIVTDYEIATGRFEARPDSLSGDLVDLMDIEGETRVLRVAGAIQALRDVVGVSTDLETGVVRLSVTTPWADLSRQVADRMLELVNRFNLETRQTQAAAERRFIERQLSQIESDLRAAEDSLANFLDRNRQYQNSPRLRFDYDRLQRRVTLRQQLFTSLSESYQQAKIDEVRNTPVITVVEPPDLPARPDERRLPLRAVLGLLLGGVLAISWAYGHELLATSRHREPDDYEEFVRLKKETRDDIGGLWRWIRSKWA